MKPTAFTPWKRGFLVVKPDGESLQNGVCRNRIIIIAAKSKDDDMAASLLDDVKVLDVVDDAILKMMR